MSRPCTIRSLPDARRRKRERMLMTQNKTQASLASGHSRFALGRHRKHMSAAMAAAYSVAPPEEREKALVSYGSDLQAEFRALIDEANSLRATAVRNHDIRTEFESRRPRHSFQEFTRMLHFNARNSAHSAAARIVSGFAP
jgi:hypothetical protein